MLMILGLELMMMEVWLMLMMLGFLRSERLLVFLERFRGFSQQGVYRARTSSESFPLKPEIFTAVIPSKPKPTSLTLNPNRP